MTFVILMWVLSAITFGLVNNRTAAATNRPSTTIATRSLVWNGASPSLAEPLNSTPNTVNSTTTTGARTQHTRRTFSGRIVTGAAPKAASGPAPEPASGPAPGPAPGPAWGLGSTRGAGICSLAAGSEVTLASLPLSGTATSSGA